MSFRLVFKKFNTKTCKMVVAVASSLRRLPYSTRKAAASTGKSRLYNFADLMGVAIVCCTTLFFFSVSCCHARLAPSNRVPQ